MKNKAQTEIGIGPLMVVFVAIIVGVTLFIVIAQTATPMTVGSTLTNGTYTLGANNTRIDLVGQDLLSTPIVTNATNAAIIIPATDYTIDEIVSESTGVKTISYLVRGNASDANGPVNISYEYGADGYVDSSGGRSMVSLIPLFFALAIAFIALEPTLRSKVLEGFGK